MAFANQSSIYSSRNQTPYRPPNQSYAYSPTPTIQGSGYGSQWQNNVAAPGSIAGSGYGSQYQNNVLAKPFQAPSGVLGAQTTQQQNTNGGLTSDTLRSKFGLNDQNVINNILADPSQVQRYLSELNAGSDPSAEIDSVFNETSNLLNDIEGRARAGEQDFYSQYSKPYEAQLPVLGQQRDAALTSNSQQQDAERRGEQNALAAAREQFGELSQGVRQRFGGVNSAAEFASSLLGRELMRNTGKIQDAAGSNVRKLIDQSNTIKSQYDTQVNALTQQKEAALAQARDAFRQRLSEIDSSRVGLAQNKAAAKLDALRELRNQAQTINNAVMQQQMNLQQLVAQADLNLRNAIGGYQAQLGKPVELSNLPGAQYSQIGGGTQTTGQNQIFGQAKRIVGYDANGQPIYG